MNVFIDDIRNPENMLTSGQMEDLVLFRKSIDAVRFFKDNHQDIEVLYLDHYIDDRFTGGDILERVVRQKLRGAGAKWNKLTAIYLHSSDEQIINRLITEYGDVLKENGVDLINKHNKNNHT